MGSFDSFACAARSQTSLRMTKVEESSRTLRFKVCLSYTDPAFILKVTNGENRKMNYRSLGRTGWNVSEISFGAWAIGGAWGQVSEEDALGALHKAIDAG